jgi:hypothetical protein
MLQSRISRTARSPSPIVVLQVGSSTAQMSSSLLSVLPLLWLQSLAPRFLPRRSPRVPRHLLNRLTVTITKPGAASTEQSTLTITTFESSTSTVQVSACSELISSSIGSEAGSELTPSVDEVTPRAVVSSSSFVDAVSSSAPSSTPFADATLPLVPTCPAANGTTFSTADGDFVIECYLDHYNNDIGIASPDPADFTSCINACASNSRCKALSYLPNGPCYLKIGLGTPYNNIRLGSSQGLWPCSKHDLINLSIRHFAPLPVLQWHSGRDRQGLFPSRVPYRSPVERHALLAYLSRLLQWLPGGLC